MLIDVPSSVGNVTACRAGLVTAGVGMTTGMTTMRKEHWLDEDPLEMPSVPCELSP
jgi:hypothetical protein